MAAAGRENNIQQLHQVGRRIERRLEGDIHRRTGIYQQAGQKSSNGGIPAPREGGSRRDPHSGAIGRKVIKANGIKQYGGQAPVGGRSAKQGSVSLSRIADWSSRQAWRTGGRAPRFNVEKDPLPIWTLGCSLIAYRSFYGRRRGNLRSSRDSVDLRLHNARNSE